MNTQNELSNSFIPTFKLEDLNKYDNLYIKEIEIENKRNTVFPNSNALRFLRNRHLRNILNDDDAAFPNTSTEFKKLQPQIVPVSSNDSSSSTYQKPRYKTSMKYYLTHEEYDTRKIDSIDIDSHVISTDTLYTPNILNSYSDYY